MTSKVAREQSVTIAVPKVRNLADGKIAGDILRAKQYYTFTMADPIYTVKVSELGHYEIFRSKVSVCKRDPHEKMYLLQEEAFDYAYRRFLLWRGEVQVIAERITSMPRVKIERLFRMMQND